MFISVLEGLALAGVIFGGFKLIKNYMEWTVFEIWAMI